MLELPPPTEAIFPENTRAAIRRFWLLYWFWFFALLPWMLLRQVAISLHRMVGTLWTWNRCVSLLDGRLRLLFMNNLAALAVTTIFGERFTAIHYDDVLIDPGPVFGRRRLEQYLTNSSDSVSVVASTHSHEEHVGNAALAAGMTGATIYGTEVTLAAIRSPERLSLPRRLFIGQPEPTDTEHLERFGEVLKTPRARLHVIESPGHCEGHASLFDRERGILFAGDSFMYSVFTSPNKEVSGAEWIRTLEAYLELEIKTMIGTHGYVFSVDDALDPRAFLVSGTDPLELIRDKVRFLRWAQAVVAKGESLGLPYSVIEASLFPWQNWWSWSTWFTDESGRLFSAGEFSRTHFVRSLSATRERVPPRFPPFARLVRWLAGSGG